MYVLDPKTSPDIKDQLEIALVWLSSLQRIYFVFITVSGVAMQVWISIQTKATSIRNNLSSCATKKRYILLKLSQENCISIITKYLADASRTLLFLYLISSWERILFNGTNSAHVDNVQSSSVTFGITRGSKTGTAKIYPRATYSLPL